VNMKTKQSNNLLTKLSRIKEELNVLGQPESKAALLKNLDDIISQLTRLRRELESSSFEAKATEVRTPLEQVIGFLERAKTDETLQTLLALAGISLVAKPKRQPIEIPSNLTNEQIRDLLQKHLTKSELKAIAMQRSISIGDLNLAGVRRSILKNLERQEGYGRLASS
jgi:hypothetical protein